jgi:hypothetical protein
MNRWVRHSQLARLEPFFDRSEKICADYFLRLDKVLLDGVDPINAQDKATELFFRLVRFDPTSMFADLETLKKRLRGSLTEQIKSPTEVYSKNLARFFKSRTSGDGWTHLDRIFKRMIGTTLSDVVDASSILYGQDDHELSQPQFYSVMLRVRRAEENVVYHDIHWAAVASDIDRILKITQEVADSHLPLLDSSRKRDNRSTNGSVILGESERWKPCAMEIHKNNQRLMSLVVSGADSGSFGVDWGKTTLIRPSMELVSSIVRIAPAREANIFKGRYLEDELGL